MESSCWVLAGKVNTETLESTAHGFARHHYERERYGSIKSLLDRALFALGPTSGLPLACVHDLFGLLHRDMNQPNWALVSFRDGLQRKEKHVRSGHELIASSLLNIAITYTETEEFDKANEAYERAISIQDGANSTLLVVSYAGLASLRLKIGKLDEAEQLHTKALIAMGSTKTSKQHAVLAVILSRIRYRQDRLTEALESAKQAYNTRLALFGEGLRTSDSSYDMACLELLLGNTENAK